MFAAIEQSLTIYEKTLKGFAIWSRELDDRYGGRGDITKLGPVNCLGETDYKELKLKEKELEAMEKVLNLNSEEINLIIKKLGLVFYNTPNLKEYILKSLYS